MASNGGVSRGGGGGGGSGGPCGACKFLRRKCSARCIFAPHFDPEQGTTRFAAVHKVFGAASAAKLLTRVPDHRRREAAATMCYEAQARLRDPVYGCVSHILALQQQVLELQNELACVQMRLSAVELLARPWQEPGHARSLANLLPAAYESTPASETQRGGEGTLPAELVDVVALLEESPAGNELQLLVQDLVCRYSAASQFQSAKSC